MGRSVEVALLKLEMLAPANLAVSVITQMELMIGCRNCRELQILEQFVRKFEIIQLNEVISN